MEHEKSPVLPDFEADPLPLEKGPELDCDTLQTDYGNALRIKFYFDRLIFFHHAQKNWFRWTGCHWQRDTNQCLTLQIVEAIRKILTVEIPWLRYLKEDKQRDDIAFPDTSFVEKSLSRSKIRAAGLLAADLMPLPAHLDAHKELLNCQNGTVDLKSGELKDHDREDYLTKIAPFAFEKDAQCPRFIAFLERAFPDNPEGIAFIQKIFGYSLTGDVSEKKIFILWGAAGNNGKTLLFNVFRGILGQCFCVQLASESLVSGRINAIRSDIAKLIGYRFVTASETDRRYKFNEALIKLLTGGDALTARHPHEREFEFTPELKLFIGTNAKPEFTLSDQAMLNRVCIIPFHVSIPPEEQDKQLTQKLINEEGEGILAWAIEGARLWAKEGLGENPFDQDSASVITPVITIDQFIKACCTQNPGDREKTHDLMTAFNLYKEHTGDESPAVNVKAFSNMIKGFGTEAKHHRDGNYREHIALNAFGRSFLRDSSEPETLDDTPVH
ncbi:hypothetical protein HTZ97_07300 [Desulfuromonas acetoxidans]|uniref:Phage/plasmid primase P4-like n=1 Tax=Desulfuromonas acetoxidans (strain DSM 684 / 11070) TaxID=281689 RepID=Q1K3K9_DESA6|nr:phage/plasmid primase, P4 family [Desulfuromonas acetoxidans]EAT16965.1 Phage/plasmid primase P4-like [Desulfuromonas acetoxidans DSM 684]MBF0644504.1 hypothetical protein [Desulfuromonas acetoxidans]NVD23969.1 hypothetical protein [Desulfuromonas acetoxidans]NVE16266.1 hypothetical protein [Desulfuromonas acetoxidans]